jgi:diguanylate cyclase (GGDEF)-like protein/PAS domain S-box-containing protein
LASHDPQDDPAGELALYRLILEYVADVIVVGDASRRRTYVSPSVAEVLGYTPEEMLGGDGFALVHPEDRAQARAVLARLGPSTPVQSLIFRMRRKDDRYIWIEGHYRHVPQDGGLLCVLRDITPRKNAEDQLAEANIQLAAANAALEALARRDGLTGLANRRHFDATLGREFSHSRRHGLPLGLVLADVDCFKLFNDRYGHLAGDDCLRRVSETAAAVLKRPGDLAARYGGEEIALLLPLTDASGTWNVAERARAAIAALRIAHADSPHGVVTISAGCHCVIPCDTETPDELIAAADRALYQAKSAGRNRALADGLGQASAAPGTVA